MNYKEEFKKCRTFDQVVDLAFKEIHDAVIEERKKYLLERQAEEKAKKEKSIAEKRNNLAKAIFDYYISLGLITFKNPEDIEESVKELNKVLIKDEPDLRKLI